MYSKLSSFSSFFAQKPSSFMKKCASAPYYNELIRSIPREEQFNVFGALESDSVVRRSDQLRKELASNERIAFKTNESRTIFLAALRNLKYGRMSVGQLASLHILDSAIHTLYINPVAYLTYKYVKNDEIKTNVRVVEIERIAESGLPCERLKYNELVIPENRTVSDLPARMQEPLMKRFFNFTDSEWRFFCGEMSLACRSEQSYHVLIAPEKGCWSSIIAEIQKVIQCMHVLDWFNGTKHTNLREQVMLVPSFTMFQAAINAKAQTLGRKPVQLIPTYGYIAPERYEYLKSIGKIAFALYLPEPSPYHRYKNDIGRFRGVIDGHVSETAFAGAIHDMYHALREMAMSEPVAKARMHLASIAKKHVNNKLNHASRPVDDILVDGELIFSYPPALDSVFNPDVRPAHVERFGELFYTPALRSRLHPELKRAFIYDMVANKSFWYSSFKLGREDLLPEDQALFDEMNVQFNSQMEKAKKSSGLGLYGFMKPDSTSSSSVSGQTEPSMYSV